MLQDWSGYSKIIGSAKHRLQLCHQYALVKRLGDKIISPHIHCHHHIHIVRSRGNEDDRHFGNFSNFTAPMVAIKKRQRNIQQDNVGIKFRKFGHNIAKILNIMNLYIPHLRLCFDCFGNSFVVLYNQ